MSRLQSYGKSEPYLITHQALPMCLEWAIFLSLPMIVTSLIREIP